MDVDWIHDRQVRVGPARASAHLQQHRLPRRSGHDNQGSRRVGPRAWQQFESERGEASVRLNRTRGRYQATRSVQTCPGYHRRQDCHKERQRPRRRDTRSGHEAPECCPHAEAGPDYYRPSHMVVTQSKRQARFELLVFWHEGTSCVLHKLHPRNRRALGEPSSTWKTCCELIYQAPDSGCTAPRSPAAPGLGGARGVRLGGKRYGYKAWILRAPVAWVWG
eukprot:scaffold51651_cov27-Phaeocystis_antarctica.AAC.1